MCLDHGHSAETPVRLEPAAPRSRVRYSPTEPLCSKEIVPYCNYGSIKKKKIPVYGNCKLFFYIAFMIAACKKLPRPTLRTTHKLLPYTKNKHSRSLVGKRHSLHNIQSCYPYTCIKFRKSKRDITLTSIWNTIKR